MWERCAVGLPTLTLAVEAKQEAGVGDAARCGLLYACPGVPDAARMARHLVALAENGPLRWLLSANGLRAVDGDGVARVVALMEQRGA